MISNADSYNYTTAKQIDKRIEALKKERDSLLLKKQELAEKESKEQKLFNDERFALDQEILNKDVKINEQVLQKSELQLDNKKHETKLVIIGIITMILMVTIYVSLPKKKTTKSWWFFHQLFFRKKELFLDFLCQNNTI